MTKYILWLLVLIYILNVADLALTLYGIDSGRAKEANPIMKVLLKERWLFIAVKLLLPIYPLMTLYENRVWVKTHVGVIVLVSIMGAVVIWNVIQIFVVPALRGRG